MPNAPAGPVKDSLPGSAMNPKLLSISVEGVSRDSGEVELNLKFEGIHDKSVLISLPLALELSKALRSAVSNYLNEGEILKKLPNPSLSSSASGTE